jgi:hypothetical protein
MGSIHEKNRGRQSRATVPLSVTQRASSQLSLAIFQMVPTHSLKTLARESQTTISPIPTQFLTNLKEVHHHRNWEGLICSVSLYLDTSWTCLLEFSASFFSKKPEQKLRKTLRDSSPNHALSKNTTFSRTLTGATVPSRICVQPPEIL